MLKIAIVDDEEAYLIYLKKVIENTCRDKHINVEVATYGSSQYFCLIYKKMCILIFIY